MPTRPYRDAAIGVGLAFDAGFVDTAALITLTGLFTAHVIGNLILIGAELVSTSTGVFAKLLALPMIILAVSVTRLIALALERRGSWPLRPLLVLEAGVLIAFAISGRRCRRSALDASARSARTASMLAISVANAPTHSNGVRCAMTFAYIGTG